MDLWLPILASAAAVFVASSVIHMVLKYHHSDFVGLDGEDEILEALRGQNLTPGDYMLPHCSKGAGAMNDPAFIEKMTRGPVLTMTVWQSGPPKMGASLAQWFGFCILIGCFAAYLTGRAVGPGAEYLEVFRFAGTIAFGGYALALLENSIWFKRKWSSTFKHVFDGFIYSLITAGFFAWLWPAAA
jgi:hypothetical protein